MIIHLPPQAGRVTRYPISIWTMTILIMSSTISLAHPICHIDIQEDHMDMVDNHIDIPYPKSISHIPYQYPCRDLIDIRSPISISHIEYRIISRHSASGKIHAIPTLPARNEILRLGWSPKGGASRLPASPHTAASASASPVCQGITRVVPCNTSHIPYRHPISHTDIPLISHIPYRYLIG